MSYIISSLIIVEIQRRYAEHSVAWLCVERGAGRFKINANAVIRQNGSYIVISVRDSCSSFCMVYTK